MLFIVEYGRNISKCVKCEKSIEIAVLRMGKFKLANSFDGAMITWYHVDCFFETTIVGTTSIAHYNKFQLLNYKDQVNLLAKIGAFPSVISDPNYREQCLRFDEVQQILTVESVKSKDLATLLKENDQFFPKGVYEKRLCVADMLTFGALTQCEKCKIGHFVFNNTSYTCKGNEKCQNKIAHPRRLPFRIPADIKKKYNFFYSMNSNVLNRILLNQATIDDTIKPKENVLGPKYSTEFFKQLFTPKTKGSIYKTGDETYSVLMSRVDIQSGKNSFYKLQLLVTADLCYFVFQAWGRIGTTRGNSKEKLARNIEEALQIFKKSYFKQTENEWTQRNCFVKKILRYTPLDVVEKFEEFEKLPTKMPESKLSEPVQNLIKLLFDEEKMKETMQQKMKIDLQKLPLGNLNNIQFTKATATLFEMKSLLETPATTDHELAEAANRFYELIPHNFGDAGPERLNTKEKIYEKLTMLEELHCICFTFDLRKNLQAMTDKHDIDVLYDHLNVSLDVLASDTVEYKKLQRYVIDTSNSEWMNDTPEFAKAKDALVGMRVKNIFKIYRQADELVDDAKNLQKMLLWHGSPLLNYVKILKHGLKIAPLGIRRIGRDLGDGIYFADLFSYSAYYCRPRVVVSKSSSYLLLLCETVVGNIKKFYHKNEYLPVGLPDDTHSVLGVGKYCPTDYDDLEKVKIPCGTINRQDLGTYFTCNEYVVYRENQVKLKYLVEVNHDQ